MSQSLSTLVSAGLIRINLWLKHQRVGEQRVINLRRSLLLEVAELGLHLVVEVVEVLLDLGLPVGDGVLELHGGELVHGGRQVITDVRPRHLRMERRR